MGIRNSPIKDFENMLQDVSDKLSQIKSNFPPDINTETDSWML